MHAKQILFSCSSVGDGVDVVVMCLGEKGKRAKNEAIVELFCIPLNHININIHLASIRPFIFVDSISCRFHTTKAKIIGNTKKELSILNARKLKTLTRFHIVRFRDAPILHITRQTMWANVLGNWEHSWHSPTNDDSYGSQTFTHRTFHFVGLNEAHDLTKCDEMDR